jgi:hypothetical protein
MTSLGMASGPWLFASAEAIQESLEFRLVCDQLM